MPTPKISPVVIIDTREQQPLEIVAYPTIRDTLLVGDYGIWGFSDFNNPAFIVERKSLDDLIGSLTGKKIELLDGRRESRRDKFMRELSLMRAFEFRAILIEAALDELVLGQYRSQATPHSMIASLNAIQVRPRGRGVHVVWAGDREGAARQLEDWVKQFTVGIEHDYERLTAAPGNS